MRDFEPIAVDEKLNRSLIRVFKKVTKDNYTVSKVNYYTYYCRYIHKTSKAVSHYYLYLLLNEFSRKMYLGITNNIKRRLSSHAKQQVLGPNNEVTLNALLKVELENIITDISVLSPNTLITSIEFQVTKIMRSCGYDVRCQYSEMEKLIDNSLIEAHLVKNYETRLEKETLEYEILRIHWALREYQKMISRGGYYYFSYLDGEKYHEFSGDEIVTLTPKALRSSILLEKDFRKYTKSDWEFIKACLYHPGLRVSLWEMGIDDPEDFVVINKNLLADAEGGMFKE